MKVGGYARSHGLQFHKPRGPVAVKPKQRFQSGAQQDQAKPPRLPDRRQYPELQDAGRGAAALSLARRTLKRYSPGLTLL